ncbi:leucine-rich repeat transmembrane protein kinase protein [Tanacetum coccineum]
MVHFQFDQSGFISLDCGIAPDLQYIDSKTGINYVSDAGFKDRGGSRKILPSVSLPRDYEIIHVTSSDYIYVCLVDIRLGNPFISAIELRTLDSFMYVTQFQSLILESRLNFGSTETVRYGDDKYDRIWYPVDSDGLVELQTSDTVSFGSTTEQVPSKVMSTALTTTDPTDHIYYPDLSYNNMTGTVPEFLASLDFLGTPNLTGNNFTRPLPLELLAKSENGSLMLIIEDACPKNSCRSNKSKKVVISVTATLAALFVLLTTLGILWIIKRSRAQDIPNDIIGTRNQRLTFSEIQSITGNFNTVIGKGGFGMVFLGSIEDNQVAVKMLSESSAQGYKEFQAEVSSLQ